MIVFSYVCSSVCVCVFFPSFYLIKILIDEVVLLVNIFKLWLFFTKANKKKFKDKQEK